MNLEFKQKNLNIRNMQEGDIETVTKISEECFSGYHPFNYKKSAEFMWLNSRQGTVSIFIAEIEGEVVGYVTLKLWLEGGWIDLIAVSEKSRRSGIAHKLVEHLTKEAQGKGLRFLSCIVNSELTSLKSFWQKCGFKIVGFMEKALSKTQDSILFYKYIKDK